MGPAAILSLLLLSQGPGDEPATAAVAFNRDIRPILSDACFQCHGPDPAQRKAGLRLDTEAGAFADLGGYQALVPGSLDESELYQRIIADDDLTRMPPKGSNRSLSPRQVDRIGRWIEQGAAWEPHWSFLPPVRSDPPPVAPVRVARNPIDAFVLDRLGREGIEPSPEADRATLLRRVTLDLVGLPPTPEEVAAFIADPSPDAYESVVDRLLASPRYGERMVWEWLDAARYADTNGYQNDGTRTMWPWRDWAIRALNDNMPFDRFTIAQIAGDLLPGATRDDRIATAFCRNHMINGEGGRIPEENRVDYVMDQSETVSTLWLGLTVGCARCHDHKFDPISQRDYYQLFAFFNNTPVTGTGGSGQTKPVVDLSTAEDAAEVAALVATVKVAALQVEPFEAELFPREDGQTPDQSPLAAELSGNLVTDLKRAPEKRSVFALDELISAFEHEEPEYAEALVQLRDAVRRRDRREVNVPRVMVMEEMAEPRDAFILEKGAYDKPGASVSAEVPGQLPPLPDDAARDRLALARWLVSAENPLSGRVVVNRAWQQFFGIGLVKTAEDFGVQGEPPSHPDLLDWLAREHVDGGWGTKRLHRLIVTSATYRQSSRTGPDRTERDPENRLLARGPRYRLPSFILRDQALAASGLLVESIGGPPVRPYQPEGIWEEATFGLVDYEQDHGPALYRRGVYTFWRRIVGPPQFFDSATRQTCTVRPSRTNTPMHALTTLNDPTFVEAARALAERVLTEKGSTGCPDPIDAACRLVLGRESSSEERSILRGALDRLRGQYRADPSAAEMLLAVGESPRDPSLDPVEHAAWTGLCLAILNLDEALCKE